MFYRLSRWTRRKLWRPLRQIAVTIHPTPLLVAVAMCWLLATNGQFRETYISYLEKPDLIGMAISALALYVLGATLYYGNYLLSTVRIDVIYSDLANLQTDWRLRSIRNWVGLLCAALPWFGLALGLFLAGAELENVDQNLRSALGRHSYPSTPIPDLVGVRARIEVALWFAVLGSVATPISLHPLHRRSWFRRLIGVLVAVLCSAATVLPLTIDLAPVYTQAGPLPATTIICLFAFAILGTLAWLSRHTGFPLSVLLAGSVAIAIVMAVPIILVSAAVSCTLLVLAVLSVLSRQVALAFLTLIIAFFAGTTAFRLWWENRLAPVSASRTTWQTNEPPALFAEWLNKRGDIDAYRAANRPYPVFIIAAEGGGIYAAAATAAFLSRLQDRCPNFAQHVFAISAVSGGSVGAAIFQSLITNERPVSPLGCTAGVRDGVTETVAARIILEDHLSSLLSNVLPDLIGFPIDRSSALEESFIRSAKQHALQSDSATRLASAFVTHWSLEKMPPALVLNATSVETGYRVAFSPFSFRGQGDQTLFSFSDLDYGTDPRLSLIRAAVVSARFPGILPAYSLRRSSSNSARSALVNFVDGGYADASGAETALALYRALKAIADPLEVDLRVVLLTSESPAPDLDRKEGTEARDLIAPVHTVLNVRELLALQAVTRALAELRPVIGARATEQPTLVSGGSPWRAAVIALDQRSFNLPLGWMMSKTTHTVVSLMLGYSELCASHDKGGLQASDRGLLIRENSCVMRSIEQLLTVPSNK